MNNVQNFIQFNSKRVNDLQSLREKWLTPSYPFETLLVESFEKYPSVLHIRDHFQCRDMSDGQETYFMELFENCYHYPIYKMSKLNQLKLCAFLIDVLRGGKVFFPANTDFKRMMNTLRQRYELVKMLH